MNTSPGLTCGRSLLSIVATVTACGPFIFDWNETHVYNPRWPPHAKFHNGQTMSMGLLLGLSALYFLFRHQASRTLEQESLKTATLLLSLYWITQLSGVMYPGSLPVDPNLGEGFPQLYFIMGCMSTLAVAWVLESKGRKEISRLNEIL